MALSQMCLASSLQTRDVGRRKRDLHASGGDDGRIHAQGLAAHGVEVWKLHEVIVREIGAIPALRLNDLGTKAILNLGMLSE